MEDVEPPSPPPEPKSNLRRRRPKPLSWEPQLLPRCENYNTGELDRIANIKCTVSTHTTIMLFIFIYIYYILYIMYNLYIYIFDVYMIIWWCPRETNFSKMHLITYIMTMRCGPCIFSIWFEDALFLWSFSSQGDAAACEPTKPLKRVNSPRLRPCILAKALPFAHEDVHCSCTSLNFLPLPLSLQCKNDKSIPRSQNGPLRFSIISKAYYHAHWS